MNKWTWCFLLAALVLGMTGCQGVRRPYSPYAGPGPCPPQAVQPGLGTPNWLHPGPAPYQQQRAEKFDPYPETDSSPTIVGARPREYDAPAAETTRARRKPWEWFNW